MAKNSAVDMLIKNIYFQMFAAVLRKTIILFWAIWEARNALVFSDLDSNPIEVLQTATRFQNDFSRLTPRRLTVNAPSRDSEAAANATWSPPPVSEIKINFDGAYRKDDKMGVGACVARDHDGRPIHSCAKSFDNVSSPALIEALALREAILLARRLRIRNPFFEGDAKSIIDFMSGKGNVGSDCEVILIDCKVLCEQSNFTHFTFIYRHCNWVAHDVAKKALRDPLFCNNSLAQVV
ncbi:uncharacterized protein LOC126657216 [Mercurialis annua]|uniref:uncharacterized protein LOC126657216 n=1 Tax=Mercurialis annua TaxID=3986 RepID=UPI00215FBEE5|nr:uncharacterized protein LOC126657216 [Mercurialis annua]